MRHRPVGPEAIRPAERNAEGRPVSEGIAGRLRAAAQERSEALRLSLRDLLQLHGEGSGAVLLMLMALLSTAPHRGCGHGAEPGHLRAGPRCATRAPGSGGPCGSR